MYALYIYYIHTYNVLSKFMIWCWATCMAILGSISPGATGADLPVPNLLLLAFRQKVPPFNGPSQDRLADAQKSHVSLHSLYHQVTMTAETPPPIRHLNSPTNPHTHTHTTQAQRASSPRQRAGRYQDPSLPQPLTQAFLLARCLPGGNE